MKAKTKAGEASAAYVNENSKLKVGGKGKKKVRVHIKRIRRVRRVENTKN